MKLSKKKIIYINVGERPQNPSLDEALKKGAATDAAGKFIHTTDMKLEAAVHEPKQGTQILYVGTPLKGLPPVQWHEVARFDEKQIGSETVVEYRPLCTGLSALALYSLELLHGRNTYANTTSSKLPEMSKAKLEGAVMMKHESGSQTLLIKFNTAWFTVCTYRRAAKIAIDSTPSRAEQGYNYKETAII